MELAGSHLRYPAALGAARVALSLLDDADAARHALGQGDEALHDLRVALRRLRSWLRAWRPLLPGLDDRTLKLLRRAVHATGDRRDAEALAGWVREEGEATTPAERAGVQWLADRLERQTLEAGDVLAEEIGGDFRRARRRLRRRLGTVETCPEGDGARPFGDVAAALVARHRDELRAALAVVRAPADQDEAHRARIEGKRLRYLVESFRDVIPAVRPAVDSLKALQDLLGEMHDAHVAAHVVRGYIDDRREGGKRADDDGDATREPGLAVLVSRATSRREGLWRSLVSWRAAHEEELDRAVDAVRAALARSGGPDEPLPTEIERKLLLRELPPSLRDVPAREIEQGYLPGARLVERVRRVRDEDGRTLHYRTVKLGKGLSRVEVEEEADEGLFRALWPLTEGRRVRKERRRMREGALTWEVDAFLDRALCLAEVELPSADTDAPLPAWLAPYVVRDVTTEAGFTNAALAR